MDIDKNTSEATPPSSDRPAIEPAHTSTSWFAQHKRWVVIGVIIAALVGGGVAFALTRDTDDAAQSGTGGGQSSLTTAQNLFLQQNGQNCKNRDVAFTSAPMKLSDLSFIRPLGAMGDGHVTPTDHVYIGNSNQSAADNTFPVLMPADGTITQISAMPAQYVGDRTGQTLAPEDHRIVISHSCRYFSIYIHIHKLSDALKAAVGTLKPNESKQVSIDLKAGDTVGYIGNSTFDWTPIDTTKTLGGFISPKLYDGESWKIHTVSPFDLYAGTLKAQLEAKSLRTTPPIGGKIDYDQPGALAGNWFRQGSGGYSGSDNTGRYWDGHLAIVPDYISPRSTIFSIGNWNGSAQQLTIRGSHDPAAVTTQTGVVKYELLRLNYISPNGMVGGMTYQKDMQPSQTEPVQGVALVQVLADEKLRVETFPGKTAAEVSNFTNAAKIYER